MDISQDYDNDGNNIVPCPICLSQFCPSKEGGKCPEEDDYKRATDTKDDPNPITASRERIVAEYDEQWPQEIEPVYIPEIRNFINTALLQHEEVVREEMARICDTQAKDGVSPYATGDEMDSYDYAKQCGFEQGATKCAHLIRTTQPTI